MKKMLLCAAMMMAAFSANAQSYELCAIDATQIGVGEELAPIAAGTVIGSTASVTAKIKFDDSFKLAGMKSGDMFINGDQIAFIEGLQGNTNIPAASTSSTSFPSSGCAYEFTSTKDGYLYLFISASGNKPYGVYVADYYRMPYIFSMENTGGSTDPNYSVYSYDVNALEGATYYEESVGMNLMNPEYALLWPGQIVNNCDPNQNDNYKTTGNGVIKVQVVAGVPYLAFATGSKMTLGAFAFDETGDATITTDTNTLLENGQIPGVGAGITEVVADEAADADAPAYNIAGQRVNKDAKGIVIINGKKYLNK